MIESERRIHERLRMVRPGKVYDERSRKYVSCATCDISRGGALLEVARPLDVNPGDRLFLGLALKRRQPILPAAEMFEVEVVRALRTSDQRQGLGVRFITPAEQLAAAA